MKVKRTITIEDDITVTDNDLWVAKATEEHGVRMGLTSEFCKKYSLDDEGELVILLAMKKRCIEMKLKGETIESSDF